MTIICNRKGQEVGETINRVYHTKRAYNDSQVFYLNERLRDCFGLDISIWKQLKKAGIHHVLIYVSDLKKDNFLLAKIDDFPLKSQRGNFDEGNKHGWDEQFFLHISNFTKLKSLKELVEVEM